jgi:hypothetical protein
MLSLPQFTNIPIMIFTSSASPSDKERVEKLITNSRYVQKPIGLDDFTREVAENVRSMLSSTNKVKSAYSTEGMTTQKTSTA